MSRRLRLLAAILAAVGLLFAQLAVSAFACPRAGDMKTTAESVLVDDGSQPANSNLCEHHCQDGKASIELGKPHSATPDLLGPSLRVPALHLAVPVRRLIASRLGAAAQPPPLLRYTVLRI